MDHPWFPINQSLCAYTNQTVGAEGTVCKSTCTAREKVEREGKEKENETRVKKRSTLQHYFQRRKTERNPKTYRGTLCMAWMNKKNFRLGEGLFYDALGGDV